MQAKVYVIKCVCTIFVSPPLLISANCTGSLNNQTDLEQMGEDDQNVTKLLEIQCEVKDLHFENFNEILIYELNNRI